MTNLFDPTPYETTQDRLLPSSSSGGSASHEHRLYDLAIFKYSDEHIAEAKAGLARAREILAYERLKRENRVLETTFNQTTQNQAA